MKTLLLTFFLLLLILQYHTSELSVSLVTVVMALGIFLRIRHRPKKLVLIVLSLLAILLILSFNMDLEYGIQKFNSEVYPVSIQDYLLFLLSAIFGYLYLGAELPTSLIFVQLFSAVSTFLIAIPLPSWIDGSGFPPVFSNTNWSGTLIICFLIISIVTLFQELRFFLTKQSEFRIASALKVLIIAISCSINFYLLLSVASRSATVAFLVFAILFLIIYEIFFQPFSQIRKVSLRRFRYFAYSVIAAATCILIYQSEFYLKLTRAISLSDQSNLLRANIYKCHFQLTLKKPLIGSGIGKTAKICESQLSSITGRSVDSPYVNHAHNFLLQISADHGVLVLIGVVILIFIYVECFVRTLARVTQKRMRSTQDVVSIGIFLTVFSIGLASMAQSAIYHVPFLQVWTGLLIGISSAYSLNLRSPSVEAWLREKCEV